uniref:DNA polymerase III subunit gamma/tau n=1 Tax=Candidatus Cryptobacteroides bacterium TaxID=3085639 RepID=UPI0040298C5C
MSEYIVSARKYRPDSFESLIGQDNIAQTLKNSIIRGKLAHAYLFCGPRGVGKTTTARIFAKAINCSNPSPDMEPCGECESCRSFQEGRSYCIHELDAASNNGVDDIKNLMDQVQIPPQVGKYSVYIIDEVHMLSTAAFNAFLKTLEEPPAHAIFILATTEKHKILPTILSRCQTYDFNRISVPDIVSNLRMIAGKEGVNIDDESLHVIAQKADGAMRDALTIFDQTVAFCGTDVKYEEVLKNLNVLDYDYSFNLVDAFLAGDYGSALLKFDEILSKGFNALHFCAALSSHFRDLMVTKNGGLEALLELPDSLKKRYEEQASRCSLKFLYDALSVTSACEAGYKQAVNPRLHIEFALMKLSFLIKAPEAGTVKVAVEKASADSGSSDFRASRSIPSPASQVSPVHEATGGHGLTEPQSADAARKPGAVGAVAEPVVRQNSPTIEAASDRPIESAVTSTSSVTGTTGSSSAAENVGSLAAAEESPAPRTRRKPVKTGVSLSLNSMIEEEENKKVVKEAAPVADVIPDDDAVLEAWKTIPAENASSPRLANTLQNAEVGIETKDGYKMLTFKVSNAAQEKWIRENRLMVLEGNLRKKVGSSRIRLEVGVLPIEDKGVQPYTDQEKATVLMGQNGEVQNLVKDFGLETR